MGTERNPRTLRIERSPRKPLPAGFRPPGGSPYTVQDGDSWKSLATRWGVDVKKLVYFNFKTNDSDEVNWYLSHVTGCNKPTPDGFNWTFSSGAKPGIIYRPPIQGDEEVITVGPPGQNELGKFLDDLPEDLEDKGLHHLHQIHFALDILEFVHMAIGVAAIGELSVGVLGLEITGPFAAELAVILSIGIPYMEAIDRRKRDWALRGISYGVVLGANGADKNYVRANFVLRDPKAFSDGQNPDQYTKYQIAYTMYLWKGFAYGKQLNNPERAKLFAYLTAQGGRWRDEELQNWSNWSYAAKKDYYERLGAIFRRDFLPPL